VDQRVIDFFEDNKKILHNNNILIPQSELINDTEIFFKWIRYKSNCKSLRLDIDVDVSEIEEGIKNKIFLSIPHRNHPGWRSITLYGYSSIMTNSYEYYKEIGFNFSNIIPDWTDISKFFPKTVSWLKKNNPLTDFDRIRFMILDPGGSSSPHKDCSYGQYVCGPINISITQPQGSEFVLENGGLVPWTKGDFRTMDLGSNHCVRNIGLEPRVHMIITPSEKDWNIEAKELACRSYLKQLSER
jgi:hypothetical protein